MSALRKMTYIGQLSTIFALLLHWSTASSPWSRSHLLPNRTTLVQLMDWTFDDVATECVQFLGPNGYGGVQISPVGEHAILDRPAFNRDVQRPWYERYQAVSYKIASRSGDENGLKRMIDQCNRSGVRVYVDVIINHMTGAIGNGTGSGGSPYYSDDFKYPAVPYNKTHFNTREKCGSKTGGIETWKDRKQLRDCELVGLHDLDQSQEYVRNKLANFMNRLIKLGVAGFRVDATIHMWPKELEAMFNQLNDLNPDVFGIGARPMLYHEVPYSAMTDVNGFEYNHLGRVIEFKYREMIERVFRNDWPFAEDYIGRWGLLDSSDSVVVVDNHDAQRGHIGNLKTTITYREPRLLKLATAFLLAMNYGVPKIMASYDWPMNVIVNENGAYEDINDWMGPPHYDNFTILPVQHNDGANCGDKWVCEHRWPEMVAMVKFRSAVGQEPLTNWWTGKSQVAFGRGSKGFIVINNSDQDLERVFQTQLSPGVYCDVISGGLKDGRCLGRQIRVARSGWTPIELSSKAHVPAIAIHVNSKLQSFD